MTNLNPSGPGSFQDALNQTGPRYILFKVSGVIDGSVHLPHGDVTIAGQTSPGGITMRGFDTTEEPYCGAWSCPVPDAPTNWILRRIRIRPGADGPFPEGLRLRRTRNAIVDHVSIANAIDEAVEISFSNDITIQNSLIAETVGDRAVYGGMLINDTDPAHGFELDRISIHHNTWNRNRGPAAELSRSNPAGAGTMMQIEISNNLLWDPGYFIDVKNTTESGGPWGDPFYCSQFRKELQLCPIAG